MSTMQEARHLLEKYNVNGAVVSVIIEREGPVETEILVQTRWKPDKDPEYSGTLEIPAGGVDSYENIYEAARREVLEETGLKVKSFYPDIKTRVHSTHDDDCFAFVPFCCQQQLRGGIPRIGVVFVCQVEDGEPIPQEGEVSSIQWMKRSELQEIYEKTPEKIFTLQLGVLDYYFSTRK